MVRRLAALLMLAAILDAAPAGAADAGRYGAGGSYACASTASTVAQPAGQALLIGPGISYQRLAVVPPCTPLRVVACEYRTGWCKVIYGRYDGWVFDPVRRRIPHHFWLIGN